MRVASEADDVESDAMSEDSTPCAEVVISHAELDEALFSPATSGAASGESTPHTTEPMGLGARLLRAFSSPEDVSRVERTTAHDEKVRDEDDEGGLQPRLQDWRRGRSAPDASAMTAAPPVQQAPHLAAVPAKAAAGPVGRAARVAAGTSACHAWLSR